MDKDNDMFIEISCKVENVEYLLRNKEQNNFRQWNFKNDESIKIVKLKFNFLKNELTNNFKTFIKNIKNSADASTYIIWKR